MLKYQRIEDQRNKKKLIVRNKSQGQLISKGVFKKKKPDEEEEKDGKGIEQMFREWAKGLRMYKPNEKPRSISNGSQRKFSADKPNIANIAEIYPIQRKPLELIREPINLGSSPLSTNNQSIINQRRSSLTSQNPVYILPNGERLYDMNMFEYNINALDSDRSNN